jgi:hypothetical protein
MAPRTLHGNKMEEASVADFIGNKSMKEASITAFTGTNQNHCTQKGKESR